MLKMSGDTCFHVLLSVEQLLVIMAGAACTVYLDTFHGITKPREWGNQKSESGFLGKVYGISAL
jgi:hypothetical protein